MVWDKLQKHAQKAPLEEVESRLNSEVLAKFGQSFTQWLKMGQLHMRQWNLYRERILHNWDCEPLCILSPEYYAGDKPLSKGIIQGMAELSSLVDIREGRGLLQNELEYRLRGGGGDKRRSYSSVLVLADVTAAIQKARLEQSKDITQANTKSQPKRTLELMPDQAQQDVLHKRPRLGLPSRSPHHLQAEGPSQETTDADHENNSAAHQYEDDISDQSFLGLPDRKILHQNGSTSEDIADHESHSAAHQYEDNTPDQGFLDPHDTKILHQNGSTSEDLAMEPADASTTSEIFEDTTTALTILEPERLLSSEIIVRVLEACAPTNCHVVDPLFLDPAFKARRSPRRVRKTMLDDISTVIVPLHHPKQSHWTVVIFERHSDSAQHLDSLPSVKSTVDEKYFHQCMKDLDEGYKDKTIVPTQRPTQSNAYDCGVHVLANSLYHMAGILELPPAHDCALWRRICCVILSPGVDGVSQDKVPLDMSAYSAELIWKKKPLGSSRHGAVEKGFSTLLAERGRARAEEKEIVGIQKTLANLSRPDASSARSGPRQSPGLLEAQQILARAQDGCARERENLESELGRWRDAARGWREEVEAEAKWSTDLVADMMEEAR